MASIIDLLLTNQAYAKQKAALEKLKKKYRAEAKKSRERGKRRKKAINKKRDMWEAPKSRYSVDESYWKPPAKNR